MYKISPEIKKFYLDNPEKLEMRKQLWREIFENELRRQRKSEKTPKDFLIENTLEIEAEYLWDKYRQELEAEPFNEQEIIKWKKMENMIDRAVEYWTFPDNEDFKKL